MDQPITSSEYSTHCSASSDWMKFERSSAAVGGRVVDVVGGMVVVVVLVEVVDVVDVDDVVEES